MKKSIFRNAFSAVGMLACAGSLQAAPITLAGDHFSVTYDDALVGVYNAGQISGSMNTVYFQPNTFSVFAFGTGASQQAGLDLSFTIAPGFVFTGLSFTERGDYFLSSGGTVNAAAQITATNTATLQSTVLDFAPAGPLNQVGGSTLWELTGALSSATIGAPQTFTLSLDSTLFSQPSTDGLGFIQATYVGFSIGTARVAAVPEPETNALFVGGLAALMLAAWARSRGADNNKVAQNY